MLGTNGNLSLWSFSKRSIRPGLGLVLIAANPRSGLRANVPRMLTSPTQVVKNAGKLPDG